MKKLLLVCIVIAVCGGALWLFRQTSFSVSPMSSVSRVDSSVASVDYKNISYLIEEQTVVLKNGLSEVDTVSGSAEKIVTRYFGNDAVGDVNGDGREDVAFLLTQNGGGTGTFYYAVVALKTETGYRGTNGVFLGDRIAPQNIRIENGKIIVDYADRDERDSMTTPPSVAVSKHLKVSGIELSEEN